MSSDLKPLIASRTSAASSTDLQWIPARSPEYLLVTPPSIRTPFVVRRLTMLFLEAGPLHEAEDCSQIEHVARFADTETPDPLLVPRGMRAVSYGLQVWPLHGAY